MTAIIRNRRKSWTLTQQNFSLFLLWKLFSFMLRYTLKKIGLCLIKWSEENLQICFSRTSPSHNPLDETYIQSISCFFVALDQILTWCLTRKLEPLCPAEPLPLCRKSENFFLPNFAQASKLLRHSRPKPALVRPTFLLSCIYSMPTLWPTEANKQFSRCFLKKVFL